jgi:transformation/transcription domain-associated protein
LSNFNQKIAEVDLPGELLLPRHSQYYVKIAKFMPRVEIVQKHNTSARRIFIQGTNGKIYTYLVINDSGMMDARREERVLQLMRMLNGYLPKFKETNKRFLNFAVPRVIAVYPQMRLVEDEPSSISLIDVFRSHCKKNNLENDAPITLFYERLAAIQKRGTDINHLIHQEIFKEIQEKIVPKNVLKNWAIATFPTATDYWTFRKVFTLQLALWSLVEYAFQMTRLNAEMMYLHRNSGLVNISYFKFEIDDNNAETTIKRPIPFRLTPNIAGLISHLGIIGPFSASIIATARCFLQPNFQVKFFKVQREFILNFPRVY